MPNAELGHGAVLRFGVDRVTPGTFVWTTAVAVLDISTPTATIEELDVTTHSSPGHVVETMPGLKDYGSFSFSKHQKSGRADDVLLASLEESREHFRVELTIPGEDPIVFPAFVTSLTTSAPVKNVKTTEATVRIAGAKIED